MLFFWSSETKWHYVLVLRLPPNPIRAPESGKKLIETTSLKTQRARGRCNRKSVQNQLARLVGNCRLMQGRVCIAIVPITENFGEITIVITSDCDTKKNACHQPFLTDKFVTDHRLESIGCIIMAGCRALLVGLHGFRP